MKLKRPSSEEKAKALLRMESEAVKKTIQGWGRARKSRAFAQGGEKAARYLKTCPRSMWGFTAKKGNWTITQVLWHLADQEANLYVRLRRAVAEPGGMVSPYDQEKWADKLFYPKADPLQALGLLRLLRKANSDLLKRVPAKDWRKRVQHPEWGPLSLDYLVGLNIWHIEHHLVQMGRRRREWKNKGR